MTELFSFNRIAPDVVLGKNVKVFGFANLYGCTIGDDTRIGTYVEIQKNAAIGARCKISSHTFICEGVTIEDEVFVGHGVMFLNDVDPRAAVSGKLATEADWQCLPVRVCRSASIGSGAVILGGVTIGEGALVGAGAVVTRDVAPNTVVAGTPARMMRSRESVSSGSDVSPETELKPDKVPFMDMRRHINAEPLKEKLCSAVTDVIESGTYILGPYVQQFERDFADYNGSEHCVALNSGTSALHLALIAAGVNAGDEVITTPLTFVSTSWAIAYVGAVPVFVDVDPVTCCINPALLEAKISERTAAILPVHLYGLSAEMDAIVEIASRHGIPVIEDAAQAAGGMYRNRHAGTLGLCGCFSFYPSKNLGACGEGGAVVTNDLAVAKRLRQLRDHAQPERGIHDELGFNYRMDALQGAVLGTKLPFLDGWVQRRAALASHYTLAFQDYAPALLRLPGDDSRNRHAWHLYSLRSDDREQMRAFLNEHGVQTGYHYPVPVHLQPAFAHLGGKPGDYPEAERVSRECLSLPLYPEMTDAEQDRVIEVVLDYCRLQH